MSNSSRLAVYKQNQIDKKSNKLKYLPFAIPKLNRYIPGFIPGVMYKITSHTGNGKTQLSKSFVFEAVAEAYQQKKRIQCLYIALEESKEEFEDSLFLYVCNVVLRTPINYYDLLGYGNNTLSEQQLEILAKAEQIVNVMKTYIRVVDDAYSSGEIYSACEKYASEFGTIDDFTQAFTPNDENKSTVFMVVVDHISLIKDPSTTTFDSMANWHTSIAKRIVSKLWKWVVINVQQQNLDSDKMIFNAKGQPIIDKVIPSIDGLGDNRTISRDDYVIIALFAPARYRIPEFEGYTIGGGLPHSLGDNVRFLYILKNRLGTPNRQIPLYFDGSCSLFKELPSSKDEMVIAQFLKQTRREYNKQEILNL